MIVPVGTQGSHGPSSAQMRNTGPSYEVSTHMPIYQTTFEINGPDGSLYSALNASSGSTTAARLAGR